MVQATLSVHAPDESAEPAEEHRTVRRDWRRLTAGGVIFALVLLWLAPAFVARTALRNRLVHAVLPQYPGTASVGGASLTWFGPVTLHRISLTDATGAELARIDEFRTSRSLAALLFAQDEDLGTLTFVRPRLSVRLRRGGSNLEDCLEPLLAAEGSSAGMTILIEGGEASWTTISGAKSPGGLKKFAGSIRLPADRSFPEQSELAAELSDGERGAAIGIELRTSGPAEAGTEISATLKEAPLAPLHPWLQRFGVDGEIAGFMSANVVASQSAGAPEWSFDGSLEGRRVRWRIAGAGDLALEAISVKGRGLVSPERLQIEELAAVSDVGSVKGCAELSLSERRVAHHWSAFASWLLDQEVAVTGAVDLPRLAAILPRAIQPAHAIESGRLEASLRIAQVERRRVGVLEVQTTDVSGGPPNRRVVWREPLEAKLRVSNSEDGIRLERLEATSAGIRVAASGSPTQGELSFEADLDRLREQVALFVPVSAATLGGSATGTLRLGPSAGEGVFAFEAKGTSRGLAVGERRWDGDLAIEAHGELSARDARLHSIRTGTVALRGGGGDGDALIGAINAPVNLDGGDWAASVTLQGELARWTERFKAIDVLELPGRWQLSGSIAANADVASRAGVVQISRLNTEVRQLRLRAPELSLDESLVTITGEASWNRDLLTIPAAKLACETASFDVLQAQIPLRGEAPASGRITFRGGIGRLARFAMPTRPPVWLSGVVTGTIDVVPENQASGVKAVLAFERPTLSRPVASPGRATEWSRVWSDDRCDVSLSGRYRHPQDALELDSFCLKASGLAVDGHGRVDALTRSCAVDLAGMLECDLVALRDRLDVAVPDGVRWSGGGSRPLLLRGPLFPPGGGVDASLVARGGLTWSRLDLFGVEVGAGDLQVSLANRTLRAEPFDWPVAGGRVQGSATADLSQPLIVRVPPGRIADSIELTPEMCGRWLRYAAPVLSDVTEVQGSTSIDVRSCSILPAEIGRSDAEGTLALEGAEATPGPLTRSLLEVVRQVQVIAGKEPTSGTDLRLVAPKQDIRVRVRSGRVFHDRFVMRLGGADGTIVTTSGSVGLDQSLDLVAEIPLSREWFKDERVAAAFGGQVLRVPVRGTLTKPAADPRALQDLARRAATGAIGGLLERGIDKQIGDPLKKLFDRGKP